MQIYLLLSMVFKSADLKTSWHVNKNGIETLLGYGNEIVHHFIAEGGNPLLLMFKMI